MGFSLAIRLIKNPILNRTPAFSDLNSNTSVIATDSAGTTFTKGVEMTAVELEKTDSKEIPLKDFKIDLLPGENYFNCNPTNHHSDDH